MPHQIHPPLSRMIRGIHGTLIVIHQQGLLLRGNSGVGKTQLAVALLKRGHGFVADDLVLLEQGDHQLMGSCPDQSYGRVHIKNQGYRDLTQEFPADQFHTHHPIHQVYMLCNATHPSTGQTRINGIALPEVKLSMQAAMERLHCAVDEV